MELSFLKKKPNAQELYIAGLNLLLENKKEEALHSFVECAKLDSENIDAFYHAGNIFCEMGNIEKAVKIHSDILNRPTLDAQTKIKLKRSLIADYIKLKDYKKAENLILDTIKSDKSVSLKEELLKLYELSGNWEKAVELKQEIDKKNGVVDSEVLALYYIESGYKLINENGREARIRLKEAIKKNPLSAWPYILIAKTYFSEDRIDDAMEFWSRLFDAIPSKAFLIFDEMEKYYFESGGYGEVGRIYRNLVEREPENLDAILALSRYLYKRGDKDEALTFCKKALEIAPENREAYLELLKQNLQNVELSKDLKDVIEEIPKMYPSKKRFYCQSCKTRTETPHWRCSSCGKWNPYNL